MVLADPIDDLIAKSTFWKEIDSFPGTYWRYNPYGMASIDLPEFFRNVVSEASQSTAIADFQYTQGHGSLALRKAIVACFAREAHLNPDSLDVNDNVITNLGALGVTEAIIRENISEKEHEAIFLEPFYPWHFTGLKNGGKGRLTRLVFDDKTNEFRLDLADIKSQLNKNTRILVLCNPGNPSTHLFTEEEYTQLSAILADFPLVRVIEDCAYFVYTNFKDRPIKYFHEIGDNFKRTYTVFSGGKIFNTTGIRLGWTFTNATFGKTLQRFIWHCNVASAFDQAVFAKAIVEATKPFGNFTSFWEHARADNLARLGHITGQLDAMGVKWYPSGGTYYLLIDAGELCRRVEDKYFLTLGDKPVKEPYRDRAVCRKLVVEKRIGLMPVSAQYVDPPKYDQFIRLVGNRNYEELDMLLGAIRELIKAPGLR